MGVEQRPKSNTFAHFLRVAVTRWSKLVNRAASSCLSAYATSVLDPNWKETSFLTELFLYAASRAQHVEELIAPALERGSVVVCDRFTASSVAYQSFGRGLDRDLVEKVNEMAVGSYIPDMTLFLRISGEEALRRRARRAEQIDRLEEAGQRLQERVALGYEAVFKEDPNAVVVDAHPDPDDIAQEINRELLKRWAWL